MMKETHTKVDMLLEEIIINEEGEYCHWGRVQYRCGGMTRRAKKPHAFNHLPNQRGQKL